MLCNTNDPSLSKIVKKSDNHLNLNNLCRLEEFDYFLVNASVPSANFDKQSFLTIQA